MLTTERSSIQTVTEAMTWLTGIPLEFGNTTQIAAVRFIEAVDRCEEALQGCRCKRDCERCDGEGEKKCYACQQEIECEFCCGTGFSIACQCSEGFNEQVISEARARIGRRRK